MAAAIAAAAASSAAAAVMERARALIAAHTAPTPQADPAVPANPRAAAAEDEAALRRAAEALLQLPVGARCCGGARGGGDRGWLGSPHGVAFFLGSHLAAVLVFAAGVERHAMYALFACRGVRVAVRMRQRDLEVGDGGGGDGAREAPAPAAPPPEPVDLGHF
jgi:hypothetical protein